MIHVMKLPKVYDSKNILGNLKRLVFSLMIKMQVSDPFAIWSAQCVQGE